MDSISNKFQPFLIGGEKCTAPKETQEEIQALFSQSIIGNNIKPNITDVGRWVIKRARKDSAIAPDSHLYRVRKAQKIRNYINENNLHSQIVVPEKYIFKDGNEYVVVSQKLDLSDSVVKQNESVIDGFRWSELDFSLPIWQGTQAEAFVKGKPRQELTSEQIKALLDLSEIYTDLTFNNFFFTKTGQLAILDTEPVKRALKKSNRFYCLIGLTNIVKDFITFTATTRLKQYEISPENIQMIEVKEKRLALWSLTKLAAKIVIVSSVIFYFTPIILASLPITGIALTTIKFSVYSVETIHLIQLLGGIYVLNKLYKNSLQKNFESLMTVANLERFSAC